MKKVFSNAHDVIHLFAQRSQSEARSNNVFFEGNKLYSYGYHYLLAEFIQNKKSQTAIYINDGGYSVTTAKHISIVTGATRQYKQFFANDCDSYLVKGRLEYLVSKLLKAKKPEMYVNQIFNLIKKFNDWHTQNETKPLKDLQDYIDSVLKLCNSNDLQAKIKLHKAQKKAKKEAKEQKETDLFLSYKTNYCSLQHDILRLSKEGDNIETSQGVKISSKEAKRFAFVVLSNVTILEGQKIEYYKVTKADAKEVKIGCHTFKTDYLTSFAKEYLSQ